MTASVTKDRNIVKTLKPLENWYQYFYRDRPDVQVNER